MKRVHLGTAGWSYKDWVGAFYPEGTKPIDMLALYAKRWSAVELDSSFYGTPAPRTVASWKAKLPPLFTMCPKFPKEISHDKFLVDCDAELDEFLGTMAGLGDRLGPLLLQFPYFARRRGVTAGSLIGRLEPFLARCIERTEGVARFVVEVRNKAFLVADLLDLLRSKRVALALIDHPYMPEPDEVFGREDLVTADFGYLRLLGDRYGIERLTKTWGREVIDQGWRTDLWARWLRATSQRVEMFVFANNHYAGYAPATMERIRAALAT